MKMSFGPGERSVLSENLSIGSLIERQIQLNPHALALQSPGRVALTYSEIQHQIRHVVGKLNTTGIGRNDRVAIVLPNGPEMAMAFITISAGATCAPLNPAFSESEFDFYLSDLSAKAIIVNSGQDSPAISVAQKRGIGIFTLSPLFNAEAGVFDLECDLPPATVVRPSVGLADCDDAALVLHT